MDYRLIAGAVVALVVVFSLLLAISILTEGTNAQDRIIDPSYVSSIHKDMDPGSIAELKEIISGDYDPYTRERAVFVLRDISYGSDNEEDTLLFLSGIVANEENDDVRTAALVNYYALQQKSGLSPEVDMELIFDGPMTPGSNLSIAATIVSTIPGRAKFGIGQIGAWDAPDDMRLDYDHRYMQSAYGKVVALTPESSFREIAADTPETFYFKLFLNTTGTYYVKVAGEVKGDTLDHGTVEKMVLLEISEDEGAYQVLDG